MLVRLHLEQLVYAYRREVTPRCIPVDKNLLALGCRQQRQSRHTRLRILQSALQQYFVMPEHAIYRCAVEKIGAVFHNPGDPALLLVEEYRNIKFSRGLSRFEESHVEPG